MKYNILRFFDNSPQNIRRNIFTYNIITMHYLTQNIIIRNYNYLIFIFFFLQNNDR